jgi:hypothetical protein
MSDYCHLCDYDPCTCGQHGKVESIARRTVDRTGPREIDRDVREFVLSSVESGVHENWDGWLNRIAEKFGPDREAVRGIWNRVHNGLQRDWLLIDDPADPQAPLLPPSSYSQVQRLPLPAAIAEVQQLIASGGWRVGEPGLRLWQVWRRIPNVAYISIYDALHDLNGRDSLVTTTAPSGRSSQFWYVKR